MFVLVSVATIVGLLIFVIASVFDKPESDADAIEIVGVGGAEVDPKERLIALVVASDATTLPAKSTNLDGLTVVY